MLTGSLADNLYDIMFLCENERRDGAMRLLRTPYEKYLYAHYISAHPETAEDFLHFDAIQSRALMNALEQHYGYKMSDLGKAGLDQMVKEAKASLPSNKCTECGGSLPWRWTKVTPEQMAKDAGLEYIHVLALRIPRHVDQRSEMMSISIPKWCRSAFRTEADQFYSCSSEQ